MRQNQVFSTNRPRHGTSSITTNNKLKRVVRASLVYITLYRNIYIYVNEPVDRENQPYDCLIKVLNGSRPVEVSLCIG